MKKKGFVIILIGISFVVLYLIDSTREHKEDPKFVKLFKNILQPKDGR